MELIIQSRIVTMHIADKAKRKLKFLISWGLSINIISNLYIIYI